MADETIISVHPVKSGSVSESIWKALAKLGFGAEFIASVGVNLLTNGCLAAADSDVPEAERRAREILDGAIAGMRRATGALS